MSSNCLKKRDEIISKYANENGIDYFCFNNRGSELARYIKRKINEKEETKISGTSYEDVLEGYEDITGAIIKLKEEGYENIYLQGHSLGCTKIVYTYNELLEENDVILNCVKGVLLLSLVDIPRALEIYLEGKFLDYIEIAENMENKMELMPRDAFIHPVCAKTFLRYAKYNDEIDFASYNDDNSFDKLNNIKVPLFMRWGTEKEMIEQNPNDLVNLLNNKIENNNKDIDFIAGANHSYDGKEEDLARNIVKFIKKIK